MILILNGNKNLSARLSHCRQTFLNKILKSDLEVGEKMF